MNEPPSREGSVVLMNEYAPIVRLTDPWTFSSPPRAM
jgi:hypothetical protein